MSKVWRVFTGILAVLVSVSVLTAMLSLNTLNLLPDGQEHSLYEPTRNAMTGAGLMQNWIMFSPNVGTLSSMPYIVLTLSDGSLVLLPPEACPDIPHQTIIDVMNRGAHDQPIEWGFAVGDARIRKYESRAANPSANWMGIRNSYVKYRATQWVSANPEQAKLVLYVDLYRLRIRSGLGGSAPTIFSFEPLFINAEYHSSWPLPGSKSSIR